MAGPLFTNNAVGTLAASYGPAATAISLTAGQGVKFPSPGVNEWFPMTIVDASNNIEIVRCTSRNTDTFTVVRGQEGTVARNLAAGEKVEHRLTAGAINAVRDRPLDASQIPLNSVGPGKLTADAVDTINIKDGAVTGSKIANGAIGSNNLGPGVAIDNLGFIPVRQGGGFGQTNDQVNIGWSEPYLRASINFTDIGFIPTLRHDGSVTTAGYRGTPQNNQNASYTLGLTDSGGTVLHTAGGSNYTLPTDAVPFAPGSVVKIVNVAGGLTITPQPGVLMVWLPTGVQGGVRTLAAPGICVCEKIAPNTWWVYGAGLS